MRARFPGCGMWRRFRGWQRRHPRASRRIALALAAWGAVCLVGDLSDPGHPTRLEPPRATEAEAALLCGGMEGPLDYVAIHTWLVVHAPGESRWERWEILGGGLHVVADDLVRTDAWSTPEEWPFGAGPTRVLARWRGAEAERLIATVRAGDYAHPHVYWAWPGPNSNTYVEAMLRRAQVPCDLPTTAIGKDYRGWVGASRTSTGTGVQLESPLLGLRVGLHEGLELHVIAATFGVDPWPPALKVPYGDGRFGWPE
ncbi:MAG: DUF3750 domain-containing protein [Planctomycetota bacterium]